MQILNSIDSEDQNLKQETTAAIAQQLLLMYSEHVPKFEIRTGRAKREKAGVQLSSFSVRADRRDFHPPQIHCDLPQSLQ